MAETKPKDFEAFYYSDDQTLSIKARTRAGEDSIEGLAAGLRQAFPEPEKKPGQRRKGERVSLILADDVTGGWSRINIKL